MNTYQRKIKAITTEFKEKLKNYQNCADIIEKLDDILQDQEFFFCDHDGLNISFHGMKKKAALEFIDENVWSRGIKTDEPEIKEGRIRVKIPQKLYLTIYLAQGDGCFQVPVGHEYVIKHEWRCV